MLRFVPKHDQDKQIPENLRALGVPHQLLSLLIDRGIDTRRRSTNICIPGKNTCTIPCSCRIWTRRLRSSETP